jgi:glycine/D-amino acid oxidase-like deaminating enzyme
VVGAGVVGAACALACVRRGLSVVVLERNTVACGTTGAGEGNLLVSDKLPGPELTLALLSNRLWAEIAAELAPRYGDVELEHKGGLVVSTTEAGLAALQRTAQAQARCGVEVELAGPDRLAELEPRLRPGLPGGVAYPQDMQVQPALAAAVLLRAARAGGAQLRFRTPVTGFRTRGDGGLVALVTPSGEVSAGAVVNAAGVWAGSLAGLAAAPVPVAPRRGFVLVTEPVPVLVRHKVYAAQYLDDVASDDAGLQASPVVEGTRGGTILIGATRERVGFDPRVAPAAVRELARGAIELFPVLGGVRAIRFYRGFRPYSPDHLPLIGPDPRAGWLVHAHGHEGAGVGLAAATGQIVAELLSGDQPAIDVRPFDPARFLDGAGPSFPAAADEDGAQLVSSRPGGVPVSAPPGKDGAAFATASPAVERPQRPDRAAGREPRGGSGVGAKPGVEPPAGAITVDGRPLPIRRGQTIAGVLVAAGQRVLRVTRSGGRPRGLFCAMGVCHDCLVTVNGRAGVLACRRLAADGDVVETGGVHG